MPARINTNGVRLANVINRFAPYYHLTAPRDVSETIALQQVLGIRDAPNASLRAPENITNVVDLITNTSEGVCLIHSTATARGLLARLNDLMTGAASTTVINQRAVAGRANTGPAESAETVPATERLAQLFKVYYASAGSSTNSEFSSLQGIAQPAIGGMFGGEHVRRNATDNTEAWHKCSIIQVNTPYVNPANKYTEAISVYMNGIPTIEWCRCVPYIDVKFVSGRSPLDGESRLNAMSLLKHIEGAVQVQNDNFAMSAMVAASSVSGSVNGGSSTSGYISETGMELFTTPHTLVNMATNFEPDSSSRRAVPVLDVTRPFMTFKRLTVDITSGGGFFAYKTGKLEFVLHDRSRLSEVADFIKPDLYGTTDLVIEYGWRHPDSPLVGNLYADLLNASRSREKYMIRNVQFAFDDVGQVNVTLDVAMRGGNELTTEVISTANESTQNAVRRVRELSELVGRYRGSLQLGQQQGTTQRTREIRGVQILDASSDAQNNIRLTTEQTQALSQFRTSLNSVAGSSGVQGNAARGLRNTHDQLYGQRGSTTSATGNVVTSLSEDIRAKLRELVSGRNDPMMPPNSLRVPSGRQGQQPAVVATTGRGTLQTRIRNEGHRPTPVIPGNTIPALTDTSLRTANVSLAKLLLHFVAQPLAATGKFDDVQMLFYPFNESAGYAKDINIGQFVVDVAYFYEQYMRFRTESASRAASVNLADFVAFLANTIIDDIGSPMYGISDLFDRVRNNATGLDEYRPPSSSTSILFQSRLEERLRSITPNGEFKHPQVQCYVEALPVRQGGEGQPHEPDISRTVLRLHFIDRAASMYQTQGALLAATRNDTLNSVSPPANTVPGGTEGINASREQYYRSVLARADGSGIVRNIRPPPGSPLYVISGGPKAVKDFVMETMPYIIYGAQGTAIKSAGLSSMQDPALSTVNMLRSFNSSPLQANGEQPGGLPLSIIPCELSMTTLGCNLIEFTQQFFIDFQTGTTADNIYGVNSVQHKVEPGVFETDIKFVPLDAYGRYVPFLGAVNDAATHLEHIDTNRTQQTTTPPVRR